MYLVEFICVQIINIEEDVISEYLDINTMDTICHDKIITEITKDNNKTIIERRTYRDQALCIGDPFITQSSTLDDILMFLDEHDADMQPLTIITMTKRIKDNILVEATVKIVIGSEIVLLERINDYHYEYRVDNKIEDYLNVNGTKITISRFIRDDTIIISFDEDQRQSICFSRECNMFIEESDNVTLKMIYNQVKDWRDDERLTINF